MPLTYSTSPPLRGCGRRIAGGAYWMSGSTRFGLNIEAYIVDPPAMIDVEALGLAAVGQKLVVRNDVTHVLDWVGEVHYPYPVDFVEEARVMGISRRMFAGFPWGRLTTASRLLLVHRHAYIENWQALRPRADVVVPYDCPRQISAHRLGMEGPCAGLWWEAVASPSLTRALACGVRYPLRRQPDVVPETRPAIFLSMPLNRIEVVRDTMSDRAENLIRNIQSLNGNRYPVSLVNE